MKADWRTFLVESGAELDCNLVMHYGNPGQELSVALTGNVFADLSHYGLLSAHGDDALNFLQSQFSNDLRLVDDNTSQLSAYCSPKGRMLASFRVFRRGDTYYCRIPAELLEPVLERLHIYVMQASVTLEDASEALIRMGVSGPDVVEELGAVVGALPEQNNSAIHSDDMTVIRVPGEHPRFELYLATLEMAKKVWDTLNVRCAPVGINAWKLLEIEAGLPTIYPQTVDLFVPQMANMQLVEGVSFKKGCYPGQEIVARMQYLGKLKRRMYLVRIETDAALKPGDELFECADAEQSVGRIADAQLHPDGGYAALAVIQISSAAGGDICLQGRDGANVRFDSLPYSFED